MKLDENGHNIPHGEHLATVRVGDRPVVVGAGFQCAVCDEWPQYEYEVEGDTVRVVQPCAYPDGITTVTEVAFPSGRIIVTDDLRPVYNWRGQDGCDTFASYNSAFDQHQAILEMARQGCAYGPVRNTCPNLYRLAAPGRFIIASPAWTEDDDGWDEHELGFTASEYDGAEKIAGVCTDLWAYSIADFEDWKNRGGDPDALDWTDTVVDVTPGVYRFTHHTGERGFDWDAPEVIFAHMELIR